MIEYGVESISWRSSLTSRVHRALGREPMLDLSENSSACDTREIDRLGISQGSTFHYPTGPFGRVEKGFEVQNTGTDTVTCGAILLYRI